VWPDEWEGGEEEGRIMAISLPDARQLSDDTLEALRLRALHGRELGFTEADLADHGKRTSNTWKTKELCQVFHVPASPLAFNFQRPFAGIASQQGYGQAIQECDVFGGGAVI
jgi:hypothetical protein